MLGGICVVGLGHAGLPTALCFSEMGWNVVGVDHDPRKVQAIRSGKAPFHEPDIDILLNRHLANGRFDATDDAARAVASSDVVVLCVGTPQLSDGSTDLSFLKSAALTVAEHIDGYTLIIEKSTVPPGTAESILDPIFQENVRDGIQYDLAVNPEFLREGAAIHDCLHPDRLVFGIHSARAEKLLQELYAPLFDDEIQGSSGSAPVGVVMTNWATAELIKQASNAFLATKISFMNMMADLCDASGASVTDLALGLGGDPRISPHYLNAGLGYGGQCLPKDLRSLSSFGRSQHVDTTILEAVDSVNANRVDRLLAILSEVGGDVSHLNIAVWGLSFKPGTDDVAEAPSLRLVSVLLDKGASVTVYDPEAIPTFMAAIGIQPDNLRAVNTGAEALSGADVLLVLTDWDEFINFDMELLKTSMQSPVIVDGRNCLDGLRLIEHGFIYRGLGV